MLPCPHLVIWKCNITPEHILKVMQPSTAQDIWWAWSNFNYQEPLSSFDILNQILWYNSAICYKNIPYIDHQMLQAGIVKVSDIYEVEDHCFLSFREIQNKFNCPNIILKYQSLILRIPQSWKDKLEHHPTGIVNPTGLDKIKAIVRTSKFIYDDFLEKQIDQSSFQAIRQMWQNELHTQIDPERWSRLYQSAMKYTRSTKHRYFQYRLLNRRLTTNVHRSKWDHEVSPLCFFL